MSSARTIYWGIIFRSHRHISSGTPKWTPEKCPVLLKAYIVGPLTREKKKSSADIVTRKGV